MLHDIVSMDKLRSYHTFKDSAMDDESINENDALAKQISTVSISHVATTVQDDTTGGANIVTMPTFLQDDICIVTIAYTFPATDPQPAGVHHSLVLLKQPYLNSNHILNNLEMQRFLDISMRHH